MHNAYIVPYVSSFHKGPLTRRNDGTEEGFKLICKDSEDYFVGGVA